MLPLTPTRGSALTSPWCSFAPRGVRIQHRGDLRLLAHGCASGEVDTPGPPDEHGDPGRRMCFGQGKPFVYSRDESCTVLITEWPNGVVDTHNVAERVVTRRWPDRRELRAT